MTEPTMPKPLRHHHVLSDTFLEHLAEDYIWTAVEDMRFGEHASCECGRQCASRRECARKWLAGYHAGREVFSFEEACAALGLRPEEFLAHLETLLCAERHGFRAPEDAYAGLMSISFCKAVRDGFRKAFSRTLEVLDWSHRHRVMKKRSSRKSGYFAR